MRDLEVQKCRRGDARPGQSVRQTDTEGERNAGHREDKMEDTVSADKQNHEVNADNHPGEVGASVRHDPVVHHHVPVLSRQDLHIRMERKRNSLAQIRLLPTGKYSTTYLPMYNRDEKKNKTGNFDH